MFNCPPFSCIVLTRILLNEVLIMCPDSLFLYRESYSFILIRDIMRVVALVAKLTVTDAILNLASM